MFSNEKRTRILLRHKITKGSCIKDSTVDQLLFAELYFVCFPFNFVCMLCETTYCHETETASIKAKINILNIWWCRYILLPKIFINFSVKGEYSREESWMHI